MDKNIFENIADTYYDEQDQLIDNFDPYDWIQDSYDFLKSINEVD